jgi:hypothetical protein
MHFVQGRPLDRLIDDGEIAPKRAARIAHQIALALAHAHEHGILHRDVKPANILLAFLDLPDRASRETDSPDRCVEGASGGSGVPMLTDFGLAKDVESDASVTGSGVTLGTPQYMPPEQAEGLLSRVDERSDVYSLGATLYEMLTFKPPFEGENSIQVIKKITLENPRPPRKVSSGIPRDLETICLKCLEKDQERRYASAKAMAEDLDRFLVGKPILARPIGPLSRAYRWSRRNKGTAFGLAAAIVLLLTVGAFTLGPGTLTVLSNPPGAEIFLSGRRTGWTTPVRNRLFWLPGTVRVGLELEGYDRVERDLDLSPLSAMDASFTLVKDHGFLHLRVRPATAKVSFFLGGTLAPGEGFAVGKELFPEAPPEKGRGEGEGGENSEGRVGEGEGESGKTADLYYKLPKGPVGLEIVAEDHETWRTTIFVTPDYAQAIENALPRLKGRLTVLSRVKGVTMKATMRGDAGRGRKPIVFSIPWRNISLDAGSWYLEFEKEGYWKSFRMARIRGGKTTYVHVSLTKRR